MDEIVRQIQQLKTLPGAIDDILPDLREMYRLGDLSRMVTALNERRYATGRQYQVISTSSGPSVTWTKV